MEESNRKENDESKTTKFRSIIDKLYNNIDIENNINDNSYEDINKQMENILKNDLNSVTEIHKKSFYYLHLPIDIDETVLTKPHWFDIEKFEKGQQFARNNLTGLFLGQLYGLFALLCHQDGLETLILTQKSHTPYLAFRRYLSTAERIRNWYKENPWDEDTKAHQDILQVRKMHLDVRRKLVGIDKNKIKEISTIKNPFCPVFRPVIDDLSTRLPNDSFSDCWYDKYNKSISKQRSLNQMDASYTLFGFMGFPVIYSNYFGIDENDRENLENFCYVWRCIGYLLGIDDRINLCCGSLEEIKDRCQNYVKELVIPALRRITPQWEHMLRCIIEGHSYYSMTPSYEIVILLFADMLDFQMPALYSSLTFFQKIKYYYIKYLYRFVMKFKFMQYLANKHVNRCMDKALHFDHAKIAELQERSKRSPLHVTVGN